MKNIGTREIRTERLLLRKFRDDDAQMMFENYCNDDEVTKYLTWPTHKTVADTQWFVNFQMGKADKLDSYAWAITIDGQVIGAIEAVDVNEKYESATIGYAMGRKWWNRGIMTEALTAVIEYLVKEAGFHRVHAYHDADNIASGRVMQKSGMKKEGVMRDAIKQKNGNFSDRVDYAILADELK